MTTPATYKAIFEDDVRGAAIFEDLVLRFSKPAVTKGGIDAVLQTYQRAGERHVIDFVIRRINQANGHASITDDEAETP